MSSLSWPFTKLHLGSQKAVAIAGVYLIVLDVQTGDVLSTTKCPIKILCSAVDEAFEHVVTVNDDKKMYVWKIPSLELLSTRELPKKSTAAALTSPTSSTPHTIIVADKFGDVFQYPLHPPPSSLSTPSNAPPTDPTQRDPRPRDSLSSHENPHGTLVLGHTSIITSMLFSGDGKYVITGDRDEHIRVSRFPMGYVIERYCLGHELYVSALSIPSFAPSSLISGGGDPSLYIWDWMKGKLKHTIVIGEAVVSLLKVRDSKEKRRRLAKERGENLGGWTKKKGKKRGKGKKGTEEGDEGEEEGDKMVVDEETKPRAEDTTKTTEEATPEDEPIIAISKIDTLETPDKSKFILFTAVGSNALFYCSYPSFEAEAPTVRHVEFEKPILHFEIGSDGRIVISVDAAWSVEGTGEVVDEKSPSAYVVEARDRELAVVTDNLPPLITTLNTTALQPATPADLKSLDLYSDLLSLPKHAADQEDAFGFRGDGGIESGTGSRPGTPEVGMVKGSSRKQNAKIEGRMKLKQALLRREGAVGSPSESDAGEERESKKARVE